MKFNNIKKFKILSIVVLLAIIFFVGTSSYVFYTQDDNFVKWSSPDETANYVFTKLYAETDQLTIFERYNLYANDIIHPRSIRSDYGHLKPVSFLGIIIIFGKVAKLVGTNAIPYLTPFIGAIGLIFYYLLIKRIFGKNNALISFLLLFSFPPLLYYSARSMFHNVLFVSLLVIGLYCITLLIKKSKIRYLQLLYSALAGFLIGLGMLARTSELLWVAPILIIVWVSYIKRIGISKLLIFISFFCLALLPMLYWNQVLYGSFTSGGYPEMNQAISNISKASTDIIKTTSVGKFEYTKDLFTIIKDNVFHFGLNAKQSAKMVYFYIYKMFPWLFIGGILGFLLFLFKIKKWKKKHYVYLLSLLVSSVILIFYYGSWKFNDNPDPNSYTIGNSYTRYWLPIYLGLIPYVSYLIIKVTRAVVPYRSKKEIINEEASENVYYKLGKKKYLLYLTKKHFSIPRKNILIYGLRYIAVAIIGFFSISYVLYGSEEGLIYSAYKQEATRNEFNKVLENTEENSVIITQYHDKLFFPERKVIVGLFNDDNMNKEYRKLLDYLPVYYYNFTFPEKDFEYLNNRKLSKANLQIKVIEKINQSFTLYKLESK